MKKSILFLFITIAGVAFFTTHVKQANAAGCPDGLEPVAIGNALPACMKVWPQGSTLPPNCAPSMVWNASSVECHPELHLVYYVPGLVLGDCLVLAETNTSGYCGWIYMGTPIIGGSDASESLFRWNGPGPTPYTPAPTWLVSGEQYQCFGIQEVFAGSSVYVPYNNTYEMVSSQTYLDQFLNYFRQYNSTWPECAASVGYPQDAGPSGGQTNPPPPTNPNNPPSGGSPTQPPAGSGTWTGISSNRYIAIILGQIQDTLSRITNPTTGDSGIGNRSRGENATVKSYRLNVRVQPNTQAEVVRQLSPYSTFTLTCYVIGEMVEGSDKWWKTVDGYYVWGGGVIENSGAEQCLAETGGRSR